jgi:hypothetical protein
MRWCSSCIVWFLHHHLVLLLHLLMLVAHGAELVIQFLCKIAYFGIFQQCSVLVNHLGMLINDSLMFVHHGAVLLLDTHKKGVVFARENRLVVLYPLLLLLLNAIVPGFHLLVGFFHLVN